MCIRHEVWGAEPKHGKYRWPMVSDLALNVDSRNFDKLGVPQVQADLAVEP